RADTWHELHAVTEGRTEHRIAVQEYGRSNPELLEGLRARRAEVTPVRVYQWDLPENTQPLREAARRLAAGEIDLALFTTGIQVGHLARIAREMGIEEAAMEGLRRARGCSNGPTKAETMREFGIKPAMEPSHPKMGYLVKEALNLTGA